MSLARMVVPFYLSLELHPFGDIWTIFLHPKIMMKRHSYVYQALYVY